jgi:hypothetical protein
MDAVDWTALSALAAIFVSGLGYLVARLERLESRLDARIDRLEARFDGHFERLEAHATGSAP